MYTIGPIAGAMLANTADFTFDADDFSTTGYAQIAGPFSLRIRVDNNLLVPVYFGVQLTRLDGIEYIADRAQIGFAAAGSDVIVSSATVPTLGRIRGMITEITIKMYRFEPPDDDITRTVIVTLYIDVPDPIVAPQPPIGKDTAALEPGVIQSYSSGAMTINANTNNQLVLSTGAILTPYRFRLTGISLNIYSTPYPRDVRLDVIVYRYFSSLLNPMNIAHLFSIRGDTAILDRSCNIIVNNESGVKVLGTNQNPAVNAVAYCTISGELLQ